MRPSDRTIRDVLRTQAARVPVPDDMWQNISRELDKDLAKNQARPAETRPPAPRHYQWRPAIIFAAAAGVFYLAFVPPAPPTVAEYEMPAHEQLERPVGAPRVQPVIARGLESSSLKALNRREYERQFGFVEISPQTRLLLGRRGDQS